MNADSLFQQAMQYFAQQNNEAATGVLQQAAELGHSMATLYLAEQYFRVDPAKAFSFLQSQWEKGVKGTLHRLVTLKAFFTDEGLTSEDFSYLYQEARLGHVESALVLLDLTKHDGKHVVFSRLIQQYAPGLLADLGQKVPDLSVKCETQSNVLTRLFDVALKEWHSLTDFKATLIIKKASIRYYRDVFSPLACEYFKLRLGPLMKPSLVHDPITGKGIQNDVRTSYIVHVVPEHLDWFALQLDMMLEKLTGVPRCRGESMNLLRYENGQQYKPHYDAIVGDGPHFEQILSDGGQRMRTAITYLSDGYSGGQTEFPRLGISVNATIGDVLVFDNLDENGTLVRDSYHAGAPVTEGTKWILTKWIRESATQYGRVVYPKQVNNS
ncbi:prolyl hydroxylase family protein [Alteromonas facilis]|uniref:prolyl hydroxylase family protein n=1 Tax=Alteromonas facilis TaxID=2048004 RepID=UPI0013DB0FE4|nr:2OG-Fe(II) oxygenase [Alteromonas facilis]